MAGNIFFVGLMGAGKTTVGRVLAKHLHKAFYDSDHEIERRTGVSIPYIFEVEGETGFRRRESAMIEELVRMPDVVVATGGGAVLLEENRKNLKQYGTVIYLRASSGSERVMIKTGPCCRRQTRASAWSNYSSSAILCIAKWRIMWWIQVASRSTPLFTRLNY